MNEELVNYISRGRGAGATDAELGQALAVAGWPDNEVAEAMAAAGSHITIRQQAGVPRPKNTNRQLAISHGQKIVLTILITLIVVFGLVVLGAFGYVKYQELHGPEAVGEKLAKGLANLSGAKYHGRFAGQFMTKYLVGHTGTSSVELPKAFGVATTTNQFDFQGALALPPGGNPKLELAGLWQGAVSGDEIFHVDFSSKLLDEVFYLNIADVSKSPLLDLSMLTNRWLSVAPAELIALGWDRSFSRVKLAEVEVWRESLAENPPLTLVAKNKNDYDFTMSPDQIATVLDGVVALTGTESLAEGNLWLMPGNWRNVRGRISFGPDNLPEKIYLLADFASDNTLGESLSGPVELEIYFDHFGTVDIVRPAETTSLLKLFEATDQQETN